MPTIPCPGAKRFRMTYTRHAWGVRGAATSKAARKSAIAAVEHAWTAFMAHTDCANGCNGPYWKVYEADVYVSACTRMWWTVWSAIRCTAIGKLNIEATCTEYNFTVRGVLEELENDPPGLAPWWRR